MRTIVYVIQCNSGIPIGLREVRYMFFLNFYINSMKDTRRIDV